MTGFVAYIWNEFWLLWNVIEDSYELAIAEKNFDFSATFAEH